jgi:Fe-S cluster biogenesis protein NfuA
MDLIERVAAALERSVLPAVIARGGAMRVAAVEDGVATLEVGGSPGAALPLASRIQDLLAAAVPEITGVRIVGPHAEPPPPAGRGGSLADRVRAVLDAEVNPVIAAHGGRVALVEADQGWVHIRLEGGCQGCSLAEVTIRQGIEPLLRARVPEMVGLVDVTDHAAGTTPFFSAEKR